MKAPLDYRRPGRETIDVAMIRKGATGPERKRIGSLLFNFGGPGESGVIGLPRLAGAYAPFGEHYDLVSSIHECRRDRPRQLRGEGVRGLRRLREVLRWAPAVRRHLANGARPGPDALSPR
jgi:hypothetical protein